MAQGDGSGERRGRPGGPRGSGGRPPARQQGGRSQPSRRSGRATLGQGRSDHRDGAGQDRRGAGQPRPERSRDGGGRWSKRAPAPTGGLGGDQVEGRRAVRELLAAGLRRTREVWVAEGLDASAQLDEIERLAARASVPVRRVSRDQLAARAGTSAPQGVMAVADPLQPVELRALARPGPGRSRMAGSTSPAATPTSNTFLVVL
ncbi:MAG: RNA methyltransferase substrate-binding domain-containing protein, partial [Acidimicrobiales bacterium]